MDGTVRIGCVCSLVPNMDFLFFIFSLMDNSESDHGLACVTHLICVPGTMWDALKSDVAFLQKEITII